MFSRHVCLFIIVIVAAVASVVFAGDCVLDIFLFFFFLLRLVVVRIVLFCYLFLIIVIVSVFSWCFKSFPAGCFYSV